MFKDILAAIPWGILLAFTIGPIFFVVIETSVIKGFRAAITLDVGAVVGDIFFILVAYFSTSRLLEKIKNDPFLFILGGIIMLSYGIFSYIKEKKDYNKKIDTEIEVDELRKSNYLGLFLKGFLLNFINIGVLGFWLGIILVFGPKLDMDPNRIGVFIATIVITYLVTDAIKIVLAKQLKSKLTPIRIHRLKRVISIILMVFGVFLMVQAFLPEDREMIPRQQPELHQGNLEVPLEHKKSADS